MWKWGSLVTDVVIDREPGVGNPQCFQLIPAVAAQCLKSRICWWNTGVTIMCHSATTRFRVYQHPITVRSVTQCSVAISFEVVVEFWGWHCWASLFFWPKPFRFDGATQSRLTTNAISPQNFLRVSRSSFWSELGLSQSRTPMERSEGHSGRLSKEISQLSEQLGTRQALFGGFSRVRVAIVMARWSYLAGTSVVPTGQLWVPSEGIRSAVKPICPLIYELA